MIEEVKEEISEEINEEVNEETIEEVFKNLKHFPLPVLITNSSNRIAYKNITGSRAFASLRSGLYIMGYLDATVDIDLINKCCDNLDTAVVTLNLSEYDCCCLMVPRKFSGEIYRIYTLIPQVLEFYSADATLAQLLCERFKSSIEAQIAYLDLGIEGAVNDELSKTVKGQVRGTSKIVLAMQNKMRDRLGLATGLPRARTENDKSVNIAADVDKLATNFNREYGREILKVAPLPVGLFCHISRAAFGRVFTYISLLCVKYAKSDVSVKVFKEDNNVIVKFISGIDMTLFLEHLEIEFSYIRTYAQEYGIEVTVEKGVKRGSEIRMRLECIDYNEFGTLKSGGFDIAPSEAVMTAAYLEATVLFSHFDAISDEE